MNDPTVIFVETFLFMHAFVLFGTDLIKDRLEKGSETSLLLLRVPLDRTTFNVAFKTKRLPD